MYAPYACCRGCRQLVPVLEGFILENTEEWGNQQERDYISAAKFARVMSDRRTALLALSLTKLVPCDVDCPQRWVR